MSIEHNPTLDAREPQQGDIETFEELERGDSVKFFEWPVEPLTVIGWEEDDNVGKRVRVEAEGGESFLYQVDGHLWHYVPEDEFAGENNPYPVQNLVFLESSEA
ncbi:hypothetical protein [Halorubrum sp. HHNYT27]|uniref:hypothetical protein n=1 Tax=Halorubrum sp. HHNYT27 TaxID=3402275 RepID=UPI003EBB6D8C